MFARMHRSIARIASLAPAVTLGAGVVAVGLGAWLGVADLTTVKEERGARMQQAILEEKMARGQQRIEQLEVELPPEQERAMRAEKLAGELKNLTSTWSWFGGNREQQRLNRERLQKVEALHVASSAKTTALQQELQRLRWEAEALTAERARIEAMVRADDERRSGVWFRAVEVFVVLRGWVVVAAGMYLVGTVLVQAAVRRWGSRRAAAAV